MQKSIVALACLAICALPCVGHDAEETPVTAGAAAPSPSVPSVVRLSGPSLELAGVKLAKAETRQAKSVLKAMGKVLAPQPQTAIVSYAYPGRVAEIRVKVGDWVEKGQTLIVLESGAVGEAKAEFFKAVAALELAKLNLDREKRLLDTGIGVKKGLVAAEAEHRMAETNLEAADKSLHLFGFNEQQVEEIRRVHEISPTVTLSAPLAGKVVASKAVLGGIVDQETEILTIIDPRRLWVEAGIYEKDLAKVKIGQKVEIVVPAYPEEIFRGSIAGIGDLVDEETRTIRVRSEVANDDLRLKPGMFADLSILRNGAAPVLVVPSAAVLEEGRRKLVFVRQEDGFAPREVEASVIEGDCVQIVRGLVAGEEIVVQGNHQLKSELQRELLEASHAH